MTLDDTQYNSRYAALKKSQVLLYVIDSPGTTSSITTATDNPNVIDNGR